MAPNGGWKRTVWQLLLTILAVKFIADLTLHSARVYPTHTSFLCLWGCDAEELRDLVSNIILFIPLGWVLRYWVRPRLVFWICVAATVCIETTQAFLLTGRDPSIRDILTNALGAAIGLWLFDHWRSIIYPLQRASRQLAVIGLGGWCVVLLVTALGLRPAGSSYPWFGHWGNHIDYYAAFDGTVQSVAIGDWTPPAGPIPDDNPLRDAIRRDSIDVHVVATYRSVTRPTALLFAVMDEHDNEMLFVGGAWRSVQFQSRTRLANWGLRGLSFRLPLSPGSEPNDTVDITARVRPTAWQIQLRTQGKTDSLSLPLSVGLGWATLLPAPLSMAYEWYVMNTLWLATLLIPGVYWWRRAGPPRSTMLSVAMVGAMLLLVPLVAGVATSTLPDWIGSALGILIGTLCARRSLTRHPAT